jgi:hypothetical protein
MAARRRGDVFRRPPALGGRPVREYQGVKMSWAALDRIVSEEIARDDGIRRRVAESGRPLRTARLEVAFRLLNNQPAGKAPRRQAIHRTAESMALGEGFGNPGMA